MAIRRANPAVANVETIHPFDDRSERRFIDERPIVTIKPNRDDQILQVRPAFIVKVEAKSGRIVTKGERESADELLGTMVEVTAYPFGSDQ